MKKKIVITGAVLSLGAALVFAWNFWGPAPAPAGQPALQHLDAAAYAQFKTKFNEAAHATRVVALLSPT